MNMPGGPPFVNDAGEALSMALRSIARDCSVVVDSRSNFDEIGKAMANVLEFHGWTVTYNSDNPMAEMVARYQARYPEGRTS